MIIHSGTDSIPHPKKLREALRDVIDPEVGMNIVDLGLVYLIEVEDDVVCVDMTMTSLACPMGEMIAEEVESALRAVVPSGVGIEVALVWSPPWEPSMMSDEARRHFEW